MRGGGATSSEAAPEYFGAKWRFAYCYKERSMDPKIYCVIVRLDIQHDDTQHNAEHCYTECPVMLSVI
jgi:hypothetical protein